MFKTSYIYKVKRDNHMQIMCSPRVEQLTEMDPKSNSSSSLFFVDHFHDHTYGSGSHRRMMRVVVIMMMVVMVYMVMKQSAGCRSKPIRLLANDDGIHTFRYCLVTNPRWLLVSLRTRFSNDANFLETSIFPVFLRFPCWGWSRYSHEPAEICLEGLLYSSFKK